MLSSDSRPLRSSSLCPKRAKRTPARSHLAEVPHLTHFSIIRLAMHKQVLPSLSKHEQMPSNFPCYLAAKIALFPPLFNELLLCCIFRWQAIASFIVLTFISNSADKQYFILKRSIFVLVRDKKPFYAIYKFWQTSCLEQNKNKNVFFKWKKEDFTF